MIIKITKNRLDETSIGLITIRKNDIEIESVFFLSVLNIRQVKINIKTSDLKNHKIIDKMLEEKNLCFLKKYINMIIDKIEFDSEYVEFSFNIAKDDIEIYLYCEEFEYLGTNNIEIINM